LDQPRRRDWVDDGGSGREGEETVLENVNYNLLETITIISRSLYRYETYAKDASDCGSCREIWRRIAETREKELEMLLRELKAHLQTGKLALK